MKEYAISSSNMLGNVFNIRIRIVEQSQPIRICLKVVQPNQGVNLDQPCNRVLAILVSCIVAIFMFVITPTNPALIKRITVDFFPPPIVANIIKT